MAKVVCEVSLMFSTLVSQLHKSKLTQLGQSVVRKRKTDSNIKITHTENYIGEIFKREVFFVFVQV